MTIEVMIDIETLDTRESAVVLSIGAVAFDPRSDTHAATLHVHLDPEPQIRHQGRTISPSTVLWWLKQSDSARKGIAEAFRETPSAALGDLQQFIEEFGAVGVWGNGAMFDNAILISLADSIGMPRPWSYKLDRCYRTLKNIVPVEPAAFEGTEHNALDDAIFQTRHLQQIYRKLGL